MLWVETDTKDLIECSSFRINQITNIQFLLANQNGYPLIECKTREECEQILMRIKTHINCGLVSVIEMNKIIKEIRKG